MHIAISKRTAGKKSEAKNIRREGNIPAVLYSTGLPNSFIVVNGGDYKALVSSLRRGSLPNTILTLKGEGAEIKALVKDIQYDKVTYDVVHMDLMAIEGDNAVNVKIPIRFAGGDNCPGVKLGGVVRQVIEHLAVRCPANAIPQQFVLDIAALNMGQSKKLSDIALPEGVVSQAKSMDEVCVVIAKR